MNQTTPEVPLFNYSDTQIFKVINYGFFDNIYESKNEVGFIDFVNIVNQENHHCSIWLDNLEHKSFYVCVKSSEEEENYEIVNLDEFGVFYEEYPYSEYPVVDVITTADYPTYKLKYSSKYTLMLNEGYTYIPLEYTIYTEANEKSDVVGEMTFLHLETRKQVSVELCISNFEDVTLYICLKSCDCDENDPDCDCTDVTFLIEFNSLRVPLHEHLMLQRLSESA